MATKNLTIRLALKGAAAVKSALASVGQSIKKFANVARSVMIAAGLSVGSLTAALVSSIRRFADTERLQVRLAAVIRATGNAAGLSAGEMYDLATALEKTGTASDETILQMMGVLATFKEVKGDTFKRASAAILDLAEVLGTDASAGAVMLGKALNDPIIGITAMTRAGIQFTDSQKDMIKSMVEAGNMAAAQDMILTELEGQMGGTALAARNTLSGAIAYTRNMFDNLLGVVGQVISNNLFLEQRFGRLGDAFTKFGKRLEESETFARWASTANTWIDKVSEQLKLLFGTDDDRKKFLETFSAGVSNIVSGISSKLINNADIIGEKIGEAIVKGMIKAPYTIGRAFGEPAADAWFNQGPGMNAQRRAYADINAGQTVPGINAPLGSGIDASVFSALRKAGGAVAGLFGSDPNTVYRVKLENGVESK